MTEEAIENKDGFLNGLVDTIIMKTFWNTPITTAKKDTSYLLGNIFAGMVQPGAYLCLSWDLINGNYKLRL